MLSAFMALLRMPIAAGKQSHALREEIEYIRQYVTVMNTAMVKNSPLTVFLDDALLDFEVPRMMLQPLVENAIFYGISAMEGRGQLCITASQVGPRILLTVEDNGSGMTPNRSSISGTRKSASAVRCNSIDLRNVPEPLFAICLARSRQSKSKAGPDLELHLYHDRAEGRWTMKLMIVDDEAPIRDYIRHCVVQAGTD